MNDQEYIKSRLDDQQTWYSKKSRSNQRWHQRLQLIQLSSAASIPFIMTLTSENETWVRLIIAFLGLGIAVIAGLLALYKFEEKWIKYRTIAESLKHEKFRYLTKVIPYTNPQNAFSLLVERVETLISQENRDWAQYAGSQNDQAERNSSKQISQLIKDKKIHAAPDEVL